MINIKKLILLLLAFVLMSTNIANAANWKEVKQSENKSLKVYYDTKSVDKENNFVTYSLLYKSKELGNYISIVYTNCSDFSSAVLDTIGYDDKYKADYSNLNYSSARFVDVPRESLLYDVASQTCVANTMNKVEKAPKAEKVENTSSDEKSVGRKILEGIGMTLLFIILLPVAIILYS